MPSDGRLVPTRLVVGLLVYTACVLLIVLRSGLSVAIIAMVDERRVIAVDSHANDSDLCYDTKPSVFNVSAVENVIKRKYSWSQSVQGTILGSYFYGYAATQMLGSYSDKYGAKWMIGIGMIVPALSNALIPLVADIHYMLIIGLRVIMGIFHGAILSCTVSILTKWFPSSEQGLALTGMLFSLNFGGVISMPLTGYLSQLDYLGGWPLVFYLTSAIHIIWFFFWIKFVRNCPEEHQTIGDEELQYITLNKNSAKNIRNLSIPWRQILTSRPVWSSIVTKMCGSFGYYLLCAKMPTYLDQVFGLSIESNSWFNSLMYAVLCLSSISGGPLSNWIKNKESVSLTRTRKVFQFFGNLSCAACLLLIPSVGCSSAAAIALLLLGMYLCVCGVSGGEFAIVAEYAPNYSGTVFGVSNTLASTTGFLGPQFVGFLLDQVKGSGVRQQWNTIWYITAAIYTFGGIVFVLFSTAKPQKWALIDNNDKIKVVVKQNSEPG